MRTTVDIPDATYLLLRSRAAAEGKSIKQLLLKGAENVLKEPFEATVPRLKNPPFTKGKPGSIKLMTNAELYDLIDFP